MRFEVRGASAGYAAATVLRDVTVVVPDGHVVALLGPNGAGKTTLLRAASKMIGLRSGELLVDRTQATDSTPEQLAAAGICHITEGRAVFPELTVRDNLRLFSLPGETEAGIEGAVAAFPRLGQRLGQVAGTMSGGEQQMLALARAYARPVQLLLLDELSMGLAPMVVAQIFDHLGQLAADGVGMLVVEQYVAKALDLADEAYVLVRGRIVLAGEPDEVRDSDLFGHYVGAAS